MKTKGRAGKTNPVMIGAVSMALTRQTKPEIIGPAGRRSTRLTIAIPISLSGKDAKGTDFREDTRTIVVNKHGAKIYSATELALGTELQVENRTSGQSARAQVVWFGKRRAPGEAMEVGVQLLDAQNIWGIDFPPDDWEDSQQANGAPAKPAEPAGVKVPEPVSARTPLTIPAEKPSPPAKTGEHSKLPDLPDPAMLSSVAGKPWAAQQPGEPVVRLDAGSNDASERQAKLVEERLARIKAQMTKEGLEDLQKAGNQFAAKMLAHLEQQGEDLTRRMAAARAEVDAAASRLERLQKVTESAAAEGEARIQEAARQAVLLALEQLNDKISQDMNSIVSRILADASRRGQEITAEIEHATEGARQELKTFSNNFVEQARKRLQEEALKAVQNLRHDLDDQIAAWSHDATAKLQKTTDEALESAARQLQSQASDTVEMLKQQAIDGTTQEARTASKAVLEEFQKQVEEITNTSLEALREIQTSSTVMLESVRKQLDELAGVTLEKMRKEAELLSSSTADAFRGKLAEMFAPFQPSAKKG